MNLVADVVSTVARFVGANWVALASTLGVLALWRVRREQVLRTRIELVRDVWDSFSGLTDAVASWSDPISYGEEDKDELLRQKLGVLLPDVIKGLNRAALFLSPTVVVELEKVLYLLKRIQVQRIIHATMSAPGPAREAYRAEARVAWEQARIHLPAELQHLRERLLSSLQAITEGRLRGWWWQRGRKRVAGRVDAWARRLEAEERKRLEEIKREARERELRSGATTPPASAPSEK